MSYDVYKTIAQYCQFNDDGRIEDVAKLFTEEGVLHISAFGIRKAGRQAVADQFRQFHDPNVKGMHCTFNAVIDIDGNTAVGSVDYLWIGFAKQPQIGIGGRYRIRFVQSDGRWLIQEMNVEVRSDPSVLAAR